MSVLQNAGKVMGPRRVGRDDCVGKGDLSLQHKRGFLPLHPYGSGVKAAPPEGEAIGEGLRDYPSLAVASHIDDHVELLVRVY